MTYVASRRLISIIVALSWFSGSADAGTRIPFGGEFHRQLDEVFFAHDHGAQGRADVAKLDAYRVFVDKKLRFLEEHVVNLETIDRGRSEASAKKRFKKLDTTIALEHIQVLLEQMSETADFAAAHACAAEILMVEYATRSYTDPIGSIKIPVHLKNILFEWRSPSHSVAKHAPREASNLVNPHTGEFYTADELAELIRSGFDISKLDPPDETPFWRAKRDISAVDVIDNYFNGGDPVHRGIISELPPLQGAKFSFDKPHLTQSKPKLDAFYTNPACEQKKKKKARKKCRQKVKLKFGMETHADPPANALLSALGFNVDVSVYLKDITVEMGNKSIAGLERDWIGYFDRQRLHTYIPLDSVVKEKRPGSNADGNGGALVFYETAAEFKPPQLERIGFFPFSWGMAQQMREGRALFLFNVWIANSDMKDEENNKLILRKDDGGRYRMYLVMQDLGHSLGRILPEKVEAFPWDLVETDFVAKAFGWVNGSIELNYIDLQENALLHNATYADLKWMARRIAHLTRNQIEAAMSLGHWPGGIPRLYVEKLINRRNQLVTAFGLEGEFPLLPVDRHLTTADGSVVNGSLVRNRWEASPINFDKHLDDLLDPVWRYLGTLAKQGIQTGVGSVDTIDPGDIALGAGISLLPRILVRLSRDVQLNPKPRGAYDQYIVVDSMELGVRLGVGYIGSVEGIVVKKFHLAYPMRTEGQARGSGISVLDMLLPYDVRKGRLPEKYVLYREDAYKYGVRVSSDSTSFLGPLGMGANSNWVTARRSVIDHRGRNPVVWIDEPGYHESDANLFLELLLTQVPFLGIGSRNGSLEGSAFVLDEDRLGEVGAGGISIFDSIVQRGHFEDAEKISLTPPTLVGSEFESRRSWWTLIFASWRSRSSEEQVVWRDRAGAVLRREYQVERLRSFSWSFLDNGETHELAVRGHLDADAAVDDPRVELRYSVDDLNSHSDEFDNYYRMAGGLVGGQTYLATGFEAADWEVSGKPSGRWTRLLTQGEVNLRGRTLKRLMELDTGVFWQRLAARLGVEPDEFTLLRSFAMKPIGKVTIARQRSIPGATHQLLIRRAAGVLETLARARAAADSAERLRLLVLALYRANFKRGDTFDPIILATLLEQVGAAELIESDELFVEARIHKAFEDESNFPERRDIVGRLGSERPDSATQYRFFPFDGVELYNMLEWLPATRSTVGPRTDQVDP